MAIPKRSSPTQLQNESTQNLKRRVITCLNKLSDRDTHVIATTELESIARNLSHDSFSSFLNCIHDTDSSEKTPVRKQCVRILGFLSEVHGDALSPFISKMISSIIRRLRDPDSVVRSACVDSVSVMASQISKPSFSIFFKPLFDTILIEQDYNLQIGSALCLASAIEVSIDLEISQLRRLLPRLIKLLKSESFKPKSALLGLIGSIIGIGGGVLSHNLLENLIGCLIEFLSSEDWSTRKATAEAFTILGVSEKELVADFRSSCLLVFESRRFDKIKVVRETMNGMIEVWKDIPDSSMDVSSLSSSSSKSSSTGITENSSSNSSSTTTTESHSGSRRKSGLICRSPPPINSSVTTTVKRRSSLESNNTKLSPSQFRKVDCKKPINHKVDVDIPQAPCFMEESLNERNCGNQTPPEHESNGYSNLETKRVLFSKKNDDKLQKFGGGKTMFLDHEDKSDSNVVMSHDSEVNGRGEKDNEDLSMIKKQLLQIENQQSNLFELLQKLIGSSRNGIRSLETRVLGLEMALDEISYDVAMSSGRTSNVDITGSTYYTLPRTEFSSSNFRRKTENQYSNSKFSSSCGTSSLAVRNQMNDQNA